MKAFAKTVFRLVCSEEQDPARYAVAFDGLGKIVFRVV
jgi:hypothetical protein